MILAEAIRRIHNGESMAYLFRNIAVDDWGNTHLHVHSCTHKVNITKHTPMTKNQVYSSFCFNLLSLFVLLIDMLTEIGRIYCMLHMKQLKLYFILWYVA